MPEGQFSGSRKVYEYTTDTDKVVLLQLDETLGSVTGCGLSAATTASEATPPPARFKPRIVYWQGVLSGRIVRKQIVCEVDSTLYLSDKSVTVTIDGVVGVTTGRRGEKLSYMKLGAVTPI